eukprot:11340241-Alexandrium_andersonii.AAC.1
MRQRACGLGSEVWGAGAWGMNHEPHVKSTSDPDISVARQEKGPRLHTERVQPRKDHRAKRPCPRLWTRRKLETIQLQ